MLFGTDGVGSCMSNAEAERDGKPLRVGRIGQVWKLWRTSLGVLYLPSRLLCIVLYFFIIYTSFCEETLRIVMLFPTLLLAAVAQAAPQFGGSQGFTMLRFGCAQNVIDRIDPLVNPGQAPSPHMHQVVGGNAFNVTMQSTDIAKLATCTTCGYSEDVSHGDEHETIEADGLGDSFPTTGPRMSTSRPAMEHTSAYLKSLTGTSPYQKFEVRRTDLK